MGWDELKDKFNIPEHYYCTNNGILLNGDNTEVMRDITDNLVVTSPPYDTLRLYKATNIKGLWNFEKFKVVAKELYRVIKDGGIVVWVVGDETINGSESGTSFRQALYFMDVGFNLHDTMIYEKAGFAKPSNNRYHQVFEYMFILSKGKPKNFNPIKDRKNKYAGESNWGRNTERQKDGSLVERKKKVNSVYGMRFNIWYYAAGHGFGQKDEIAYKHPATFPEQLAYDHIVSWSNEGDIVLDPFAGSGTTLKMAEKLKRHWIGIEISEDYCNIIKERMEYYRRNFGNLLF